MDKTKKKEEEVDRFIRFIKRCQDEGLFDGTVALLNLNPKTNEPELIRLKVKK